MLRPISHRSSAALSSFRNMLLPRARRVKKDLVKRPDTRLPFFRILARPQEDVPLPGFPGCAAAPSPAIADIVCQLACRPSTDPAWLHVCLLSARCRARRSSTVIRNNWRRDTGVIASAPCRYYGARIVVGILCRIAASLHRNAKSLGIHGTFLSGISVRLKLFCRNFSRCFYPQVLYVPASSNVLRYAPYSSSPSSCFISCSKASGRCDHIRFIPFCSKVRL